MAKQPKKPQGITNNLQNNLNQTLKLDSELSKTRQRINQGNYQKNREQRKEKRRERYQQQKEQAQQTEKEQLSKYYEAESIKILMSFKDYTELNPAKKKLWLDFNWTLQDCQKSFKEGYADVVAIMKLEQVAHSLVSDYWVTAKSEKGKQERHWNNLDYDEQQRLIRYWGYEKARVENNYIEEEERLEKQSREYLKAIELAKFHEERGKKGCKCWQCEQKATIQKEVKAKIKKELEETEKTVDSYWGGISEKEQCPECNKWVKELDEEAGTCRSCKRKYK